MYIPSAFAETEQEKLHDFIEQHSFATLVSLNGGEPFASHLPVLLEREAADQGRLIGHMAKANPQWKQADGQTVLAIFHGPHTYISPAWYEEENVVPTWNYVAVHVVGTLRIEDRHEQIADIVRRYVEFYESSRAEPWRLDSAEADFISGLVGGIIGFEIDIERIEGKWKLNQNQSEERRQRVIKALQDGGGEDQLRIAEWMTANDQSK